MEKRTINPWTWQDAFGFVQANEVRGVSRTLVCAGQTANEEGKPIHAGDMRAQIEYTMDNLEKVLAKGGFELSDVVRLNYYTTDVDELLNNWDALMMRLEKGNCKPASTLLGVTRLASREYLIEIEATAMA